MTTERGAAGPPDSTPLAARYDGLICDLDGVIHHGDRAVPGAAETLQRLAAAGLQIIYATNNASRRPQDVAATLTDFGAPAAPDSVVTSAQAGAARVRTLVPAGSAVLAVGGPGVAAALEAVGLVPVAPSAAVREEAPSVSAVLQGYGPALTVADFTEAARQLRNGPVWVATNADTTLPQPWGLAPGNGAYVELLRAVTGRDPVVVGKPEAPLYELAVERLRANHGGRRVLAVGDRLDTDVDGAAAAGLHAAWVLTGVHLPADLLRRPATAGPRYVVAGLGDLEVPYAAPRADADGWVCGAHRARVSRSGGGRLVLHGPRPWGIELIRAGLAALLEARDAGSVPAADLVAAAEQLDDIVTAAR